MVVLCRKDRTRIASAKAPNAFIVGGLNDCWRDFRKKQIRRRIPAPSLW
jgi:hypothetical protein